MTTHSSPTTPPAPLSPGEERYRESLWIERILSRETVGGVLLLAATVQGGSHPALRERAAAQVSTVDADMHPIGGVVPLMEQYRYAELATLVLECTTIDGWHAYGTMEGTNVRVGFDQPDGIVGDLGGSSLEFQRITPSGQDGQGETHKLGPFAMAGLEGAKPAERRKAIRKVLKSSDLLTTGARRLYAVGGSWRALASVHMDIKAYPLAILHGYPMNGQAVRAVVRTILSTQRDKELASHISGIVGRRFDTILHAALVLDEVFDAGGFKEVLISANGLREGVLFDQGDRLLFETMRAPVGDALIDGTIAFLRLEQPQRAFGEALYRFIRPVLPKSHQRQRIFKAACLMTDCGGRFHPDHRADMAYYLILRSPIRAVSHDDRVLLAHATGARYTHKFQRPKQFARIGRDSDDQLARIMGAAMRLGAVYSGRSAPLLSQVALKPSKSKLVLEVDGDCEDMISGTVRKRFEQLATFMDLDAEIRTV